MFSLNSSTTGYSHFKKSKQTQQCCLLLLFDYDDQMTNNFNNFRNLKALNHKTTRVMGAGRAKVNKKCTERDKDVHIVKECQTLMIGYITSLFSCMFNSKKKYNRISEYI